MRTICFAILFALSGVSCTYRYYYQPASSQPQQASTVYTHGVPSLRLYKDSVEVFADLTNENTLMHDLNIYIRNDRSTPLEFDPANILVTGYNGDGTTEPFRVFSAEQYISKRQTEAVLISVAAIAAVTTAAVIAANNDNHGSSENSNDFDDNVFWWLSVSPNIIINNPYQVPYMPADGLLRRYTLFPGDALQGIVKVKARNSSYQHVLIEVPIDSAYLKYHFGSPQRLR
ncbi:MAG: hypothetical protein ACOYPR_12735 [Saprospiraceae bacterium]